MADEEKAKPEASAEESSSSFESDGPGTEELHEDELDPIASGPREPLPVPPPPAVPAIAVPAAPPAEDADEPAVEDERPSETEGYPSSELSVTFARAPSMIPGTEAVWELPPPAFSLGRYGIIGRLAVGGMAEIYLAEEEQLGQQRLVAVKVLTEALDRESSFEKLFRDEGAIALKLAHPHVCTVHEFGETAGRFFIAMEYIHGASLWELFREGNRQKRFIPFEIVAHLGATVASALSYAHHLRDANNRKMGVVHRDVSPQNIMLRGDGVIKLVDFGVAKVAEGEKASPGAHGKVGYMSPEQCRSDPSVDGRSDVFSLGVCLYEALTARRLFAGAPNVELLRRLCFDDIPPPHTVRSSIPEALSLIVARAVARDPAERFESAAQLERALREYLASCDTVVTQGDVRDYLRELISERLERAPEVDRSPSALESLRESAAVDAETDREAPPLAEISNAEEGIEDLGLETLPGARPRPTWLLAAALLLTLLALFFGWRTLSEGEETPPQTNEARTNPPPEIEPEEVAEGSELEPTPGEETPEAEPEPAAVPEEPDIEEEPMVLAEEPSAQSEPTSASMDVRSSRRRRRRNRFVRRPGF